MVHLALARADQREQNSRREIEQAASPPLQATIGNMRLQSCKYILAFILFVQCITSYVICPAE